MRHASRRRLTGDQQMPQFLVIAYDGTDPEAPARRLAARPGHLEGVKPMVASGEMIVGGAILDEAGAMIGSATVVEFADRAALDAWLARDPYVTGKVWQKIEIRPFRVAVPVKG
jgi:uncharacterized protein YciI